MGKDRKVKARKTVVVEEKVADQKARVKVQTAAAKKVTARAWRWGGLAVGNWGAIDPRPAQLAVRSLPISIFFGLFIQIMAYQLQVFQ
jgi:hypothetical protein